MAPVTRRQERLMLLALNARRAEARKLKMLYREDGNGVKTTEADNDASKPTCFFDESLLACDICLEIMHNAMNVSPCNHKFCAGCIYEWNSLNNKCPKCRWSAVDITRDATLNSIIEQYLIAFPEKRRDKAQLIELDERELNHLEQWERKRDSDEGDYDYDMDNQFFESEDSDTFEVQLESDEDDGLEYSSSDRWSENDMIGSFDEDDDENDSDRQDEYISRRNLEKARMERLRREKEERDRLKELEAERSRKTSAKSKKEKSRERRCGTGGGNGRATNTSRSNTQTNNASAATSTRSVVTRSMTLRSRNS